MPTRTVPTARGTGSAGFAILFVLVWSSGYLVGGVGTRVASPTALGFWRFLFATAVLAVVVAVTRPPWPDRPSVWAHQLCTGFLLQTVQFAGAFIAMGQGMSAGLAALIADATPLVVAVAAVPLFGEHLRARQVLGLVLGFGGVLAVVGADLGAVGSAAGLVAAACGLAGASGGALYQKAFGAGVDLRTAIFLQLAAATAGMAPLAAITGGFAIPVTFTALGTVAWLALVGSIGAFVLLFILLRRHRGAGATSYLFFVPPVTAVAGTVLLDQPLTAGAVAGFALATVGVALVTRPGRRSGRRGD